MRLWQYPSLTEPVSQEGENITLDKWWQETARPVFDRRLPTALMFTAAVLVELVSPPALADIGWLPPTEQPVRIEARQIPTGLSFVDIVSEVLPEIAWTQPTSQPKIDVSREQFTYPSLSFVQVIAPPVSLDQWGQPTNQPRIDIERSQYAYPGLSLVEIVVPQVFVELDKWYRPLQEPFFIPDNTQYLSPVAPFAPITEVIPVSLPGKLCGDVSIGVKLGGDITMSVKIAGDVTLNPAIDGTITIRSC